MQVIGFENKGAGELISTKQSNLIHNHTFSLYGITNRHAFLPCMYHDILMLIKNLVRHTIFAEYSSMQVSSQTYIEEYMYSNIFMSQS